MPKLVAKDIDVSIVIPCYNEGASLPTLLEECREFLDTDAITFIIVNNGSTDNTLEILKEADLPENIVTVNLIDNVGYGGGILKGLEKTKTNFVGWTHADLQTQISDLHKAISILRESKNIEESIFIKGRRVNRQFVPKIFSIGMGYICSLILQEKLRDVNAQPTIMSRKLIMECEFRTTSFSFDLEAYFYAKNAKANEIAFL